MLQCSGLSQGCVAGLLLSALAIEYAIWRKRKVSYPRLGNFLQ